MDNKMKAILPSLQDMALIKIATSLWNENHIIHHIFSETKLWFPSDVVRANIQSLDLPLSLSSRLVTIVSAMGAEICEWKDYTYCNWPKYLHLFYWTYQGTLDQERTVMGLLRNEAITVFDRFRMACFWCLESEISSLWDRMDKSSLYPLQIRILLSNEIVKFWMFQMDPNNYWIYDTFKKFHPRPSNFLRIIQEAVRKKNFPAVKYFFPKLSNEEKKKYWSDFSASGECIGRDLYLEDIVHFIFSSMDQEYQNELLRKFAYKVLFTFTRWPWLNHFLEYSKLCWNFLSLLEFQNLLETILGGRLGRYGQRYYYEVLFEDFWTRSPISLRRFMVRHDFRMLFHDLDEETDADKISQFLKHTSVQERYEIISSDCGMLISMYLFIRRRWLLFRRFLAECLLTSELVVKFRKDFVLDRISKWTYVQNDKNDRLEEVENFFDTLLRKRSDEENGCFENFPQFQCK